MAGQSNNNTIGFIGAGRIGRPLIRALLAAGYGVDVYDKHKTSAKEMLALGASWAATPSASAQAVKLLTSLVFYGSVSICGDCLAITQSAGIPCHWMWEKIRSSQANSIAAAQFIPMLLDGSYDRSCSLEIAMKDMSLTIALADEMELGLPLGRAVNDRYADAGNKIDQSENHLMVTRLSEEENKILIRIPEFSAPSKYGSNTHFEQSDKMDIDAFGRETPQLPSFYRAPEFRPTRAQQDVVDAVIDFMAESNYTLNEEAVAIGLGVGLEREAIEKMIIWSVGANWVLENPKTYVPTLKSSSRKTAHLAGLKPPLIQRALTIGKF